METGTLLLEGRGVSSSLTDTQQRQALLWAQEVLPFHTAATAGLCSPAEQGLQNILFGATEEIMLHSFQLE